MTFSGVAEWRRSRVSERVGSGIGSCNSKTNDESGETVFRVSWNSVSARNAFLDPVDSCTLSVSSTFEEVVQEQEKRVLKAQSIMQRTGTNSTPLNEIRSLLDSITLPR